MPFPILILLTSLFVLQKGAHAEEPSFTFGIPTYSGQGCPAGTFAFAMSPSDQSFSVLYDEFRVEVSSGKTIEAKECIATIPVMIPPRVRLEIVQADYRGFRYLPLGASGELFSDFQFGAKDRPHSEARFKFKGFSNEEFTESYTQSLVSRCGGNEVLKIQMRLFVKANPRGDLAFIELNTKDVSQVPPPHLELDFMNIAERNFRPRKEKREHKIHLKSSPCDP